MGLVYTNNYYAMLNANWQPEGSYFTTQTGQELTLANGIHGQAEFSVSNNLAYLMNNLLFKTVFAMPKTDVISTTIVTGSNLRCRVGYDTITENPYILNDTTDLDISVNTLTGGGYSVTVTNNTGSNKQINNIAFYTSATAYVRINGTQYKYYILIAYYEFPTKTLEPLQTCTFKLKHEPASANKLNITEE